MSDFKQDLERKDGLTQENLDARRRWLYGSVPVELIGALPEQETEARYSPVFNTYDEFIEYSLDAADILADAIEKFDNPDVDMYLTPEAFAEFVAAHMLNEREWPNDNVLRAFASVACRT